MPQLLRTADIAGLTALVATTHQHHDLFAVSAVIDPEAGTKIDPQLKDAAADRLVIAKVSGAHAGQPRIHRRLHFLIAQGIEPLVKRDESVRKFQLLDFPRNYRIEL